MVFKPREPEKEFGELKAELTANNRVVKRPIGRLDDDIVKRKRHMGGRPNKYSPTRFKNEINKYFAWCEKHDEIPTIKGLMIYMKLYKDTFYAYLRRPEYTDILEQARLMIANWCEIDVYNTKGMATGKIAYMKNIHGWSDKISTENTTTTIDLTPETARAKLESLAPMLLEVLKNGNLLEQLVKPKEIDVTPKGNDND